MLKDLREKNKLTQSELAKLTDLNIRTLQDYEQGRKDLNNAKAITVYKLSKALKCDILDLLKL